MNRHRAGILLIALIAIGVGAVREFLFLNLYYQVDFLEHHRPFSYAHSLFQGWTAGLGLPALGVLKWLFSIAFMAIMLALAIALARMLTGDHRYTRTLLLGYIALATMALGLHLIGPPLAQVGMKLLHALQYPVVLLLIWAASALAHRPSSA